MQVTGSTAVAIEMDILLIIGEMGVLLLIAALVFLAARLVKRNYLVEEEGILEDDNDDEYSEHFNSNVNEGAIFIIDQGHKFNSLNVVNCSETNE